MKTKKYFRKKPKEQHVRRGVCQLDWNQVEAIRDLYSRSLVTRQGWDREAIATQYSVSHATISRITAGKYSGVEPQAARA